MSELTTDETRTERFNDVARAFTAPLPRRQAKLMPFREGILELREKGASLGLIRELLATIGVSASKATIARFLVEVANSSKPTRPRPRSNPGRGFVSNTDRSQPTAGPPIKPSVSETPLRTAEPPSERPRTRGPRVADPRNL